MGCKFGGCVDRAELLDGDIVRRRAARRDCMVSTRAAAQLANEHVRAGFLIERRSFVEIFVTEMAVHVEPGITGFKHQTVFQGSTAAGALRPPPKMGFKGFLGATKRAGERLQELREVLDRQEPDIRIRRPRVAKFRQLVAKRGKCVGV